eukprot:scaffold75184_cov17-Prasinocladus_malaysianus.AAC.1
MRAKARNVSDRSLSALIATLGHPARRTLAAVFVVQDHWSALVETVVSSEAHQAKCLWCDDNEDARKGKKNISRCINCFVVDAPATRARPQIGSEYTIIESAEDNRWHDVTTIDQQTARGHM